MRLKFNVDTKLYFLIGDPMAHSCTGFVNNGMFEYLRENAVLVPITLPKGKLAEFVAAAKLLGAKGFYLTMPHKEDIVEYLDECDDLSRAFHSVNHVKILDNKLIGIGLDGMGMGLTVEKAVGNLAGKRVLLLGAGAVAGAIAADLCKREVGDITIANRTVSKAENIAQKLHSFFPNVATQTGPLDDAFLIKAASDRDIVVQSTSLGINAPGHENFTALAFMDKLPKHCFAADVLYPNSSFLQRAKELGLKNENGIKMTIYQQKEIMKFQFNVDVPDDALVDAEENFRISVAIRDFRFERLAGKV